MYVSNNDNSIFVKIHLRVKVLSCFYSIRRSRI